MSAANIIIRGPAAHLVTDAAAIHDDGTVGWIGSKVLALPRLRAALTTRGRVYVADLAQEIERAAPVSLAKLVEILPDALSAALAVQKCAWPAVTAGEWSTIVNLVGWCPDRARPIAYLLASDNEWVPAPYVPWTMHSVGRCFGPGVARADAIVDATDDMACAAVQLLKA